MPMVETREQLGRKPWGNGAGLFHSTASASLGIAISGTSGIYPRLYIHVVQYFSTVHIMRL